MIDFLTCWICQCVYNNNNSNNWLKYKESSIHEHTKN
jgi:hypothetical protein